MTLLEGGSVMLSLHALHRRARVVWLFKIALLTMLACAAWSANCLAGDPVVRVEEDWELRLLNPDSTNFGPQVSCVISPTNDIGSLHVVFTMNYRGEPNFQPGGMQLQLWNGSRLLSQGNFPKNDLLSAEGETVRWTQQMRLGEGTLVFEIVDGSSATWGAFGGEGYLKQVTATSLDTLAGYRPTISSEQSGIGFASNRVSALILKEVRCYTSDGTVYRSTTPRVVHQK